MNGINFGLRTQTTLKIKNSHFCIGVTCDRPLCSFLTLRTVHPHWILAQNFWDRPASWASSGRRPRSFIWAVHIGMDSMKCTGHFEVQTSGRNELKNISRWYNSNDIINNWWISYVRIQSHDQSILAATVRWTAVFQSQNRRFSNCCTGNPTTHLTTEPTVWTTVVFRDGSDGVTGFLVPGSKPQVKNVTNL